MPSIDVTGTKAGSLTVKLSISPSMLDWTESLHWRTVLRSIVFKFYSVLSIYVRCRRAGWESLGVSLCLPRYRTITFALKKISHEESPVLERKIFFLALQEGLDSAPPIEYSGGGNVRAFPRRHIGRWRSRSHCNAPQWAPSGLEWGSLERSTQWFFFSKFRVQRQTTGIW